MLGRCIMWISCLPNWLVHPSSSSSTSPAGIGNSRSPRTRKNASRVTRLSVSSYRIESFMVQRTPFLLPINNGITVLSPRSAHLAGRYAGLRVGHRTPCRGAQSCILHLCGERPEAKPPQVRSRRNQCPVLRQNHRFNGYQCGEFSLSTDYKNILYKLSTTHINANVARKIGHKTQRRALRLSDLKFTMEYIPRALNTWADLLTCWRFLEMKSLLLEY